MLKRRQETKSRPQKVQNKNVYLSIRFASLALLDEWMNHLQSNGQPLSLIVVLLHSRDPLISLIKPLRQLHHHLVQRASKIPQASKILVFEYENVSWYLSEKIYRYIPTHNQILQQQNKANRVVLVIIICRCVDDYKLLI